MWEEWGKKEASDVYGVNEGERETVLFITARRDKDWEISLLEGIVVEG